MVADADMEDYGFEYSDEEPEEQDVDIENQYYNSKGTIRFLKLTLFCICLLYITWIWEFGGFWLTRLRTWIAISE